MYNFCVWIRQMTFTTTFIPLIFWFTTCRNQMVGRAWLHLMVANNNSKITKHWARIFGWNWPFTLKYSIFQSVIQRTRRLPTSCFFFYTTTTLERCNLERMQDHCRAQHIHKDTQTWEPTWGFLMTGLIIRELNINLVMDHCKISVWRCLLVKQLHLPSQKALLSRDFLHTMARRQGSNGAVFSEREGTALSFCPSVTVAVIDHDRSKQSALWVRSFLLSNPQTICSWFRKGIIIVISLHQLSAYQWFSKECVINVLSYSCRTVHLLSVIMLNDTDTTLQCAVYYWALVLCWVDQVKLITWQPDQLTTPIKPTTKTASN